MNLPVERTKTYQQRLLPMGQRLRSILEMCQTDPKGQSWPPSACVFGNEVGELIKSVKTAWKATCRRAGITDLHFNDLRHEFGCRLLESGSGLHDVRGFLGHASITTTSRYLQSSSHRLADALTRMETRQRQGFPESVAQTSHKTSDLPPDPAVSDSKESVLLGKSGAGERTRTVDLLITNQLLYQLSYAGFLVVSRCAPSLRHTQH